jgi:CRP/FNR family transcriptional regulator
VTAVAAAQLRTRLETVPLFAACHPGDLGVIVDRSEIRDVSNGAALITQGAVGEEFFVLLEGTAAVWRNGTRVGQLEAGAHFGELALLDPAPRDGDVVMASDGVVSVLSRHNFVLVLDAVPGIVPVLLAFLARRLRDAEIGAPNEVL